MAIQDRSHADAGSWVRPAQARVLHLCRKPFDALRLLRAFDAGLASESFDIAQDRWLAMSKGRASRGPRRMAGRSTATYELFQACPAAVLGRHSGPEIGHPPFLHRPD
jgi:hypothetical protein